MLSGLLPTNHYNTYSSFISPTPMNKPYILLLAAFAVWSFGIPELRAQNPEWVVYSDTKHIISIAQEGDFLWIASYGGITKLNRHTLESTLLTGPYVGLSDIMTIAVQSNGRKWVGTQVHDVLLLDNDNIEIFNAQNSPTKFPYPVVHGTDVWFRKSTDTLIRYDGENWHTIDVSDVTEGGDHINSLYASNNTLWAGSFSTEGGSNGDCRAIYRLDNDEWTSVPLPAGNNLSSIYPVAFYRGTLWCIVVKRTSNIGLMTYNGTNWTEVPDITSSSMTIDSTGRAWIPGSNNNIIQYEGVSTQSLDLADTPLNGVHINNMFTDSDGIIWIGTDKNGLFQYKNNRWTEVVLSTVDMPAYTPSPSHSWDASLSSITVDTDQSLWLNYGTNIETHVRGEAGRINSLPFGSEYASDQFCGVDKKGNRWIASSYGLWRRFNGSWEKLTEEKFKSLYIDRADNLWLGTDQGVTRYNNGEWTYYTLDNSDFYSSCIAMTESKDGTLWAATPDNLLTFDGTTWTAVETQYPEELFGGVFLDQMQAMITDSSGLLWMLPRYGQKVFTFDGATWTEYNTENAPFTEASFPCILTDRTGNIWIVAIDIVTGKAHNKLFRVDHATREWTVFTPENSPLPYEPISCMAVDSSNNLWIGMVMPHKLVGYRAGGILVDVSESNIVHTSTIAMQNFPNPATSYSTLRYTVPPPTGVASVHIQLFNSLGVPVRTLEQSSKTPGEYTLDVDTAPLTSGIYYYRIQIGDHIQNQQLIVVK
jgi:ligand-binding sensor domain-containing protein